MFEEGDLLTRRSIFNLNYYNLINNKFNNFHSNYKQF